MKKFVIALTLAIAPVAAHAAPVKWQYIGMTDDGSYRWYYDANSIKRSKAGTATLVTESMAPDGNYTLTADEYDCSLWRWRMHGTVSYNSQGMETGREIRTSQWLFLLGGSIAEMFAKQVCGNL